MNELARERNPEVLLKSANDSFKDLIAAIDGNPSNQSDQIRIQGGAVARQLTEALNFASPEYAAKIKGRITEIIGVLEKKQQAGISSPGALTNVLRNLRDL